MLRHPGFSVGTYFGIPVTIHPSWFFVLALATFTMGGIYKEILPNLTTLHAYSLAFATLIIGFTTLIAHEFGHALAARWFGIGTERITLFLLGGVAQVKDEPASAKQEFIIAIAGPLVSLVCAVGFAIPAILIPETGPLAPLFLMAQTLAIMNTSFFVFNLMPGFPMDGGRVLRATIWGATGDYLKATRLAVGVGQFFGYALAGLGGFLVLKGDFGSITLIIMGFFVAYLAKTAMKQAEWRAAFDRVLVGQLMRPVEVVVPADLTLRQFIDRYVYRMAGDRFPVVRGDELLGWISSRNVAAVDRSEWETLRADRLVKPFAAEEILSPDQDLNSAVFCGAKLRVGTLPVFRGRRLVGFLSMVDVQHHLKRFA